MAPVAVVPVAVLPLGLPGLAAYFLPMEAAAQQMLGLEAARPDLVSSAHLEFAEAATELLEFVFPASAPPVSDPLAAVLEAPVRSPRLSVVLRRAEDHLYSVRQDWRNQEVE